MDYFYLSTPFWRVVGIVLVTLLLHKFSKTIIERIVRRVVSRHHFEHKKDELQREDTLIGVLHTGVAIVLWITASLLVLDAVGVNLAALATGAGLFGIVIGLGAQSTIKDFLSGVFILLENQYRVGDIVTLSGGTTGLGTSGVVEDITLRITKLRDLDGNLHTVRNGEATIITNRTYKYSSVVVDITVPYESDITAVESLMNQVGKKIAAEEQWKKLMLEPISFLRVDAFTESGVTARAMGRVTPASQWEVAGAYRRELLSALKKAGVEVGLPQIVVHNAKKS